MSLAEEETFWVMLYGPKPLRSHLPLLAFFASAHRFGNVFFFFFCFVWKSSAAKRVPSKENTCIVDREIPGNGLL